MFHFPFGGHPRARGERRDGAVGRGGRASDSRRLLSFRTGYDRYLPPVEGGTLGKKKSVRAPGGSPSVPDDAVVALPGNERGRNGAPQDQHLRKAGSRRFARSQLTERFCCGARRVESAMRPSSGSRRRRCQRRDGSEREGALGRLSQRLPIQRWRVGAEGGGHRCAPRSGFDCKAHPDVSADGRGGEATGRSA